MLRVVSILAAAILAACGPIVVQPSDTSPDTQPEAEVTPRAPVAAPRAMTDVILHCDDPEGAACRAMTEVMGVMPRATTEWPADLGALGTYRDEADDCGDPDLTEVLAASVDALGIDPSNWHDNGGRLYDIGDLSQTSSGGGCTNCCWSDSEAAVKAQVVERDGQQVIVVRVWEVGADG